MSAVKMAANNRQLARWHFCCFNRERKILCRYSRIINIYIHNVGLNDTEQHSHVLLLVATEKGEEGENSLSRDINNTLGYTNVTFKIITGILHDFG